MLAMGLILGPSLMVTGMLLYLSFIMYYGSELLLFTCKLFVYNISTGGCSSHHGIQAVNKVADLNSS